jgi:predicted amidohydrolase YtcJ
MDPDRPSGQAVAIQGDTILAVGSDQAILALVGDDTTVIDLDGPTVLPGFNDAHSHLLGDHELAGFPDLESAVQEALRLGYTSIKEMFANEDRLNPFRALDRDGNLPIRINTHLPLNYGNDRYGDWYQAYPPGLEYSPFLRIAGVKVYIDSGDYGKKYMTEPYADNPGYRGEVYWTQSELTAVLAEAYAAGYQIAAHTGGDAALDMILNSLEDVLNGESNEAYHHRVEHVMIARDDQVQRMRELGIVASVQLSFFNSDWGDEFESTLRPERTA